MSDDETTYSLQLAKSNRAKCRGVCKENITKGEMKILMNKSPSENMSYGLSHSYHVSCFKISPRKLGKITAEEFVEEYLVDDTDEGVLLEKKEEIVSKILEASSKKKKEKEIDPNNIMERLKVKAKYEKDDDGDDRDDKPAKKKAKTFESVEEEEEFKKMLTEYRKYAKIKLDGLKDFLRWNHQIMGGVKAFVLFKVIDGVTHGRLGFCPLCQGQLKFNFSDKDYDWLYCGGRFDEDLNYRITCSYKIRRLDSKVPRLLPFYQDEPTEEEKEELLRIKEEIQEGDTNTDDNPVAQGLLEKVSDLELDLTSNEGKKKAAFSIFEIVDGKLDMPTNRQPVMEIGKVLMNDMSSSPKEIMEALIKKYGFADEKKEKVGMQVATAETGCANPKNATLVLALNECGGYYFKEGNHNAGGTYIKASAAISNLKDEITEENAMSFCKGKTKVAGIGKATAQRMKEFTETGTFEKLEEKRAAHA
mmetsp:Transcript_6830/g.7787  ORF Transcript_6830/g.7787 Transcript_6830/m.7787 type:complete len:476 (+) Transcript_6830:120-1547(+)